MVHRIPRRAFGMRLLRTHGVCTGLVVMALTLGALRAFAQESPPPPSPPRITLSEENNLASLLDLCVERLGLNLEYDRAPLRGIGLTLRLGSGVTDQELWTLTNRLLAAHNFTTVRMAGEDLLSVVELSKAAQKAGVDEEGLALTDRPPGFSSVVRRIEHADPAATAAAIQPLLSKPAGVAARLGETDFLLISDLTPRLEHILEFTGALDRTAAAGSAIVERIELAHAEATQLVAQVNAAVQARNLVEARDLPGKLAASLDGGAVVLVAPREAAAAWRSIVAEFDRRVPIERRTYSPTHFALDEVARLVGSTVPLERGGSGDRWKLVEDHLLGGLIVTATVREHEAIERLLARLESAPPGSLKPVQTFPIRNRDAGELLAVIEPLLEDVVASAGPHEPAAPVAGTGTDPSRAMVDDSRAAERPDGEATPRPRSAALGRLETSSVTLSVDEHTNALIAFGEPRSLARLEALVRRLDVRQPQVEIEVLLVSLSDSDSLDLGVELQKLEVSGETLIGLSSLFGLADIGLDSTSPLAGGRGFSGVVLNPGDFSVVVRALETLNVGRSRSAPKVLVANHEEATLDSVRQEPFISVNASDTVATTSFGGTIDAGTQVTITPHIAEGDHVVLEYSVSLSAFVGESSDPVLPPPLQETSVQSVVTIPDGYVIAVGGLEIERDAEAITQVPGLGGVPVLGEFFKNRSRSTSRSRFYVFIRANVLRRNGFEDLKHLGDAARKAASVDDGFPELEPQVIH